MIRETREETAYIFTPQWLQGIYSWHHPRKDITYLRFAFSGQVGAHDPQQALDDGIVRAVWLTVGGNSASPSHATAARWFCSAWKITLPASAFRSI